MRAVGTLRISPPVGLHGRDREMRRCAALIVRCDHRAAAPIRRSEPETGRLLAAETCLPAAEHLAHLLALAIERQMTVADMLAMTFYHPVLKESLRSALRDLAKAVSGTGGSDLSDCGPIGHDALD